MSQKDVGGRQKEMVSIIVSRLEINRERMWSSKIELKATEGKELHKFDFFFDSQSKDLNIKDSSRVRVSLAIEPSMTKSFKIYNEPESQDLILNFELLHMPLLKKQMRKNHYTKKPKWEICEKPDEECGISFNSTGNNIKVYILNSVIEELEKVGPKNEKFKSLVEYFRTKLDPPTDYASPMQIDGKPSEEKKRPLDGSHLKEGHVEKPMGQTRVGMPMNNTPEKMRERPYMIQNAPRFPISKGRIAMSPTQFREAAPRELQYSAMGYSPYPMAMHQKRVGSEPTHIIVEKTKKEILMHKKLPNAKYDKRFRCPETGCLQIFARYDELKAHLRNHILIDAHGPHPRDDGSFVITEQMLKNAYEILINYPMESAKLINEIELLINNTK